MRDWDQRDEPPSTALKIETALLLIAWLLALFFTIMTFVGPTKVAAHPGGLAAEGCQNDRKNGGRHCHGRASVGTSKVPSGDGKAHYPNCTAARAADVTQIYRGQPGYGTHLDPGW